MRQYCAAQLMERAERKQATLIEQRGGQLQTYRCLVHGPLVYPPHGCLRHETPDETEARVRGVSLVTGMRVAADASLP